MWSLPVAWRRAVVGVEQSAGVCCSRPGRAEGGSFDPPRTNRGGEPATKAAALPGRRDLRDLQVDAEAWIEAQDTRRADRPVVQWAERRRRGAAQTDPILPVLF